MGKSEHNTLDLLDDPKTVLKKIKAIPMVTEPTDLETDSDDPDIVIPLLPAGVGVVYRLLDLLAPREVYLDFLERYRKKERFFGDLKKTLAKHVSEFNEPIIERYNDPAHDQAFIEDFLRENAKRVTPVALDTVESCREAMGIGRSLYRA